MARGLEAAPDRLENSQELSVGVVCGAGDTAFSAGAALAGGFGIALACDLIVAERTAVFGLPEVTRGLIANGGGLLRLARALPRAQALDLILTGRRLDAEEAARLGLVTRVVDQGAALSEALGLAATIAAVEGATAFLDHREPSWNQHLLAASPGITSCRGSPRRSASNRPRRPCRSRIT
ncbi:MAG TPA: enoyl-CoA hydratase-related protein, partial [Streptosporangiaceae bacterium]